MLFERDLGTGRDRMVSDRDGSNIGPAYSPDGLTIAFATTVAGNTEIATVGRGGLQQQTRGRGFDSLEPTYSPDGRQFAFVSNRLGEPHIYLMTVAGTGDPRLISDYSYGGEGYNVSPDWSPKGNQIVYSSRIGGRARGVFQVVLADLDAGTRRLLTNQSRNEEPNWAADGRHIVFASPDREGGGLFVLDTVSGRVRSLLRGTGYSEPDWSPVLRRVEETAGR
jgi:TolB protein